MQNNFKSSKHTERCLTCPKSNVTVKLTGPLLDANNFNNFPYNSYCKLYIKKFRNVLYT